MSRFDYDDGEGMPWGLWKSAISNALAGRRGQKALADMEEALLALPKPSLIEGYLVHDGQVCAVGALVAHQQAKEQGIDIAAVIEAMDTGLACGCGHNRAAHRDDGCIGKSDWRPRGACSCTGYEPDFEDPEQTAQAGERVGLRYSVAWHLAWLNDEEFRDLSPEERFIRMLAWVRRAQGKDMVAA